MTCLHSCLRLYSTALVLLAWAVTWSLGVRGEVLIGAWLIIVAFTVTVAERERSQQRKRLRSEVRRARK